MTVSVYSDDNTAPCNVEEKSSALCDDDTNRRGAMRFGGGGAEIQKGECEETADKL